MERQKTTIQVTRQTKIELMKIKGELLGKDGLKRTMDDVIRELEEERLQFLIVK